MDWRDKKEMTKLQATCPAHFQEEFKTVLQQC